MSYDRPAHMRLYFDAVSALPLPGERMTVDAYEKVRDLLWDDVKAREPQQGEVDGGETPDPEKRGTELHRGGSLASSERAWTRTISEPDTVTFGFGRRSW